MALWVHYIAQVFGFFGLRLNLDVDYKINLFVNSIGEEDENIYFRVNFHIVPT